MSAGPHVSINAETLFTFGGVSITNSLLTSLIVSGVIILFALLVRLKLKKTHRPKGIQNFAEWLVESLYNLTYSIAGNVKKSRFFFPFIATFFLFIVLNNWIGLLPGVSTIGIKKVETKPVKIEKEAKVEVKDVEKKETADEHALEDAEVKKKAPLEAHKEEVATKHDAKFVPLFRAGTADINTTLALALVSVFMAQLMGLKFAGASYLKKFFNFSNPVMFFVGVLEVISEFAKIISFAFRLFGNIFAGEVLLAVISFLVPLLIPAPFYGMEIFVGFIQALVFVMLTLVFFNMATQHHDH